MYKIEALVDGQWSDDAVGRDPEANEFDTRAGAEAEIPKLAKTFDAPVNEFRVVES